MEKSDALREAFLTANANREFIAEQLADVIRNLVRAFAANDPSRPIYYAAEKMDLVMDLVRRCEDPLSWHGLFTSAIADIHNAIPPENHERGYVATAQSAMKYLVEISSTDNAARGRASRRLHEFLDEARGAVGPSSGR